MQQMQQQPDSTWIEPEKLQKALAEHEESALK
jgi:hypothetical protein